MKIIRPTDVAGKFQSSAPPDSNTDWGPIGRNLYSEWDNPIVTASGDTAVVALRHSMYGVPAYYADYLKLIKFQNLADGSDLPNPMTELKVYPSEAKISPDGNFLAIVGRSISESNYYTYAAWISVYSLATGLEVYSDSQAYQADRSRFWWSGDSAYLYFGRLNLLDPKPSGQPGGGRVNDCRVRRVDIASWGAFDTPDVVPRVFTTDDRYLYTDYLDSVCVGGTTDEVFYTFRVKEEDEEDPYGPDLQDRYFLAKYNYGTQSFSYVDAFGERTGLYGIIYNPVQSHVLGVRDFGDIVSYSQATLTESQAKPNIGAQSANAVNDIIFHLSPDGQELAVITSASPRIELFKTLDYAKTAQGGFGSNPRLQCYSSTFFVMAASDGGIELVDRATLNPAVQVNPSVTAGDIYTYSSANYEALANNNDRPDLGATLEVPTWLNLGAINPLRMFDGKLDTLTTAPSPLTVNITPGQLANGIALFNVTAQTVQITMTDPVEGLVYDSGEIQMLDNASIRDWYSFFFEPYLRKADAARINLPPYPDATITVTLSAPGEDVSVGQLVLGTIQRFGNTVYGTSVGITDFSRKEADVFGNYQIVERRFSKRAEYDVSIDTRAVASVQRTLAAYRAKPVVWVGAVEQEETIVYGYYRDFDIVIDNFSTSDATITVEGL